MKPEPDPTRCQARELEQRGWTRCVSPAVTAQVVHIPPSIRLACKAHAGFAAGLVWEPAEVDPAQLTPALLDAYATAAAELLKRGARGFNAALKELTAAERRVERARTVKEMRQE